MRIDMGSMALPHRRRHRASERDRSSAVQRACYRQTGEDGLVRALQPDAATLSLVLP